jgi:hypothetical protein
VVVTGAIEVVAEGLGHPEGPDVLPDGRVVFANLSKLERHALVEEVVA